MRSRSLLQISDFKIMDKVGNDLLICEFSNNNNYLKKANERLRFYLIYLNVKDNSHISKPWLASLYVAGMTGNEGQFFKIIFNALYSEMYKYALKKFRFDSEDVDIVLVDSFRDVFRHIDTINPNNFMGYLIRTINRNILDNQELSSRKHSRLFYQDDDYDELDLTPSSYDGFDPVVQLFNSERKERIDWALNQLKEEQRIVINLKYEKGLSIRQIANELSIPESTVIGRLQHAKTKLNTILEDEKDELL